VRHGCYDNEALALMVDPADQILVGPIALPMISAAKTCAAWNSQPGSGRLRPCYSPMLSVGLQAVHANS